MKLSNVKSVQLGSIMFLSLLFSTQSIGLQAQEMVRIGTQDSPLDRSFYAEFEALYAHHGYQIKWVVVPVERSILEAAAGNLDANLYVTDHYDNKEDAGYLTHSELFDIDLIVICSLHVACTKNVLYDDKATFIGPSLASRVKKRLGYKFRFEQVEDVKNYLKMVASGRFNYAIALGRDSVYSDFSEDVRFFIVEKTKMHHFISKHRQDIYQALTSED